MRPGARPREASALVLERGEAGQQGAALLLPGLPPVATRSHAITCRLHHFILCILHLPSRYVIFCNILMVILPIITKRASKDFLLHFINLILMALSKIKLIKNWYYHQVDKGKFRISNKYITSSSLFDR